MNHMINHNKKFSNILSLLFLVLWFPFIASASGSGGGWLAFFAYIGGFPVLILALLIIALWKLSRKKELTQSISAPSIDKEKINSYLSILVVILGAGLWYLTNFGRSLIWSDSSDVLCYQTFGDSCSFVFQVNGITLGSIFILISVGYLILYPVIQNLVTERGILNNTFFTILALVAVALFGLGLLPIFSSSLLFRLPFPF